MEDDGPNFGYAYGEGTSTSWNPAHRPISRVASPERKVQNVSSQAGRLDAHYETHGQQDEGASHEHLPVEGEDGIDGTDENRAPIPTKSEHAEDLHILSDVPAEVLIDHEGEKEYPSTMPGLSSEGPAAADHYQVAETLQQTDVVSSGSEDKVTEEGLSEVLDNSAKSQAHNDTSEMIEQSASGSHEHVESVSAHDMVQRKDVEPQSEAEIRERVSEERGDDMAATLDKLSHDDHGSPSIAGERSSETYPPASEAVLSHPEDSGIDWGTSDEQDLMFSAQPESSKVEANFAAALADTDLDPPEQLGLESIAGATKPQDSAWDSVFDDAELLEEPVPSEGPKFFEDDGEGFLDDVDVTIAQPEARIAPSSQQPVLQRAVSNAYAPGSTQPLVNPNAGNVRPQGPPSFPSYGSTAPYGHMQSQHGPQSSGQSFADKAKTGYTSPYDLPDVLAKPRRRPAGPGMSRQSSAVGPAPPPRSTSLGSMSGVDLSRIQSAPATQGIPSANESVQARPPSSGYPNNAMKKRASLDRAPTAPQGASSSFFEDLPVTTRARGPVAAGRYTPQVTPQTTPQAPQGYFPPMPPNQYAASQPGDPQQPYPGGPPRQHSQTSDSYSQFRLPDRPPLFPDQPTHVPAGSLSSTQSANETVGVTPNISNISSMAPPTIAASRYSPAPPSQPAAAGVPNRYTAEAGGPPRATVKPFAPRTSSPLAQFTSSPDPTDMNTLPKKPLPLSGSSASDQQQQPDQQLDWQRRVSQGSIPDYSGHGPPLDASSATSPPQTIPSTLSPRKRSAYAPSGQLPPVSETGAVPPTRSQSQSPGSRTRIQNIGIVPVARPASAFDMPSPDRASVNTVYPVASSHRRNFSQEKQFMPPQDERLHDPLERWKGAPLLCWGAGGQIVTTFPSHTPRYSGNQTFYTSTPGPVTFSSIKTMCPPTATLSTFPGPLRKGKKKEVAAWLKSNISALESQTQSQFNPITQQTTAVRAEEKVLLWKIVLVLAENDGVLEGNPAVHEAVRAVLQTDDGISQSHGGQTFDAQPPSSSGSIRADAVKPAALSSIGELLTRGEREKAAWLAVDECLWGHALLISSTLNRDLWRKIVQEFVLKEVKSAGPSHAPLSALYEVFAGNWEESVDQLVPASARAGFQMISTAVAPGSGQDVSAGLDKWRATLLLILNNRTSDDNQALIALGKLLSGYGRVEAAHICYLFARQNIYFAGPDNSESHMTLLGLDAKSLTEPQQSSAILGDTYMESIMLTEVYEFALSSSLSGINPVPHLQSYKLYHASILAEAGLKSEAQQYCDSISSLVGSKTKRSPYYNAHFEQQLEDLSKRLSQAPTTSSSWITKPTMDKVGSSFYTKFSNFIAGDDSDAASNGSGPVNEVGPFARIAESPTISRTTSAANLHDAYTNGKPAYGSAPIPIPTGANSSRYAPTNGNTYAPRTSSEQTRPLYVTASSRTSLESTRVGESAISPAMQEFNSQGSPYAPYMQQHPGAVTTQSLQVSSSFSPPRNVSRTDSYQGATNTNGIGGVSYGSHGINTPLSNSFTPSPYRATPEPESTAPHVSYETGQPSPQSQYGYQPASYGAQGYSAGDERPGYHPLSSQLAVPLLSSFDDKGFQQADVAAASLDQVNPTYEPPTSTYEPPSYQSYEPEPQPAMEQDSINGSAKPKKKSFMDDNDDDDDGLAARAAALKGSTKAANDKAANDAFLKAAEADAKRDQTLNHKPSWFGGWFGGKKDPNAPQSGPIKAKLGEENSFVYDPDLKKWINKKAGAEQPVAAAPTPPPPKGPLMGRGTPPPGAMGPPGGVRSASGSNSNPPGSGLGLGHPLPVQRAVSTNVTTSVPPGSGPPSRAGTPLGGAPPVLSAAMLPPSSGAKPPSRPTTSMSNASSIDDLIGPAAPRKGAAKKKKGGGRYVDVMANNS